MAADFVTEEACKRTREGMYKDLTRIDGAQCLFGEELSDTKVILAKLTVLTEIAIKNQDDFAVTVKEIDRRILDREVKSTEEEVKVARVLAKNEAEQALQTPKFWETPTGTWIIKMGVWMLIGIMLIALGQDIAPAIVEWLKGKI